MPSVVQARRLDPTERLPGEGSLLDEARKIFADADQWMHTAHPLLGGRTPQDCIDGGDEQLVWDLLRNIKHVGQT
jgi:uncharacterized protein (DUF2384 family)